VTSGSSGEVDVARPPVKAAVLKPRDAATLIIVDRSQGVPRVLLGKRRMDMKFMPGKYVFPGGRVDRSDRLVSAHDDLKPKEITRLLFDMKGGPSELRARALAFAAIRETYEEAGLIIGAPAGSTKPPNDKSWQAFYDQGFAPSLSSLMFFARAITPPGRPRRFDTRFFCADAASIVYRGAPLQDELSDHVWMALEDARGLDLPPITRTILEDLGDRLALGPLDGTDARVPYYFFRNGSFKRELIAA
jgi:8-oxo-dGTP pyrophosphatase MutT (NUDIX family)